MPSRLIPLFPLHVVVLPRTRLPLHIFEERYKLMVGEAIRGDSEFGVVLARNDGIVNTGCTVKVQKVLEMYPDGRMDVMTRGERRFEIANLNEEADYLQGEVEFFDDDDFVPVEPELRENALLQFREFIALKHQEEPHEPDMDDAQLSFQLASGLPDLDFLSNFQRERSERRRLQSLIEYLAEYIPRQRTIDRMKHLAPTNGFGSKPAGL
jgi:Lon protease-like protein